jgi:hypothetical protein
LRLIENDDPLEAGLEIFAKPPGKKPATLSLLSGGEQALTALALIFAVFLTNPAPICVLDEVDAPLDDHNVERFCTLLHEMTASTETRFVIITHNPITMARMNRLFGVTMAERGVSQLVSVDLENAVKILDQHAPRPLHAALLPLLPFQTGFQLAGKLVVVEVDDRSPFARRTWFFLDEVREAGKLELLGRLLTKGRSKGVALDLGFQDISGMREAYGQELADELLGQCNTKILLRVNSPQSAAWAAKQRGWSVAFLPATHVCSSRCFSLCRKSSSSQLKQGRRHHGSKPRCATQWRPQSLHARAGRSL